MATFILSLALPFFFIFGICTVEPTFARRPSRSQSFIEASCHATRYPALCVQSLSVYAKPTTESTQQLSQITLSVSLYKALNTRAYLLQVTKELKATKSRDYQVVNDCLQQIDSSVDRLSQSIKELHSLDHEPDRDVNGISWHVSNVETWVSSAMTGASDCLDELPRHNSTSKLKATIKAKVLNVAQCTSNALSLFRQFAAKKYGAGADKKP